MRLRSLTATAVALLTIGSSAAIMAAPATAVTAPTPTVTVTPYYTLSTTEATPVDVKITNFEDSTMLYVAECSAQVLTHPADSASDCDASTIQTPTTDASGSAEIPAFSALSASYTDPASDKCDQYDPCAIVVADALVAPTDKAAQEIFFGPYVSATPNTNLKNKQTINIFIAGFTASESSGSAIGVECSQKAAQFISNVGKAETYCDTNNPLAIKVSETGTGTAKFVVGGGPGYTDAAHDKCDGTTPCFFAVTSDLLGTQFNYTTISFAKSVVTPVKTTTKVSGAKHGKTGTKDKITAKTTAKTKFGTLTGTVVFTDNGKKVASVSEKASGTVSAKIKLKHGKNKIVATYKGSSHYISSKGSLTVTGK